MPTKTQLRLVRQIEGIERELGLNPRKALETWRDDPEGTSAHLNRIRDFLVAGYVLSSYTFLDMLLDYELKRHFFTKKRRGSARTSRLRTLGLMLPELYPIQKLRLIEQYRRVPRSVHNTLYALNDVRNSVAHDFFLRDKPGER